MILTNGHKKTASEWKLFFYGAGDEARTRYLHLGKVALYRMSYTRSCRNYYTDLSCVCQAVFSLFSKIYVASSVVPSVDSLVGSVVSSVASVLGAMIGVSEETGGSASSGGVSSGSGVAG